MATYFADNFNRADQSGWGTASGGGSWSSTTAGSGFSWAISSNTGTISGNFNGALGAWNTALSQQNNLVWTGTVKTSGQFVLSGGRAEDIYLGVRSDGTQRLGNGYGIHLDGNTSNNLEIIDAGTQKAVTTFSVSNSTTYNYEIDIDSNNHMDVYIWTSSKPGTPTISFTNGGSPYTPTASGSAINCEYEPNQAGTGTVTWDDILVQSPVTPSNSGFFMAAASL